MNRLAVDFKWGRESIENDPWFGYFKTSILMIK
jgi:hypothetical protein